LTSSKIYKVFISIKIEGVAMTKRQLEYKKKLRKQISGGLIKERVQKLEGDWRGELYSRLRALIKEADPQAMEVVKFIKPDNPLGTAMWDHNGTICSLEVYKNHLRMTFPGGAQLDDPSGLFNSSLDARVWRAINFEEGYKVNEKALKALIRAAAALNTP
jgi:hypothetical protein